MAKRATVLVIEDDNDVSEAIMALLEDAGYEARSAPNGEEALRMLRSATHPQIILVDLMMPVMDGWKFREIQRQDAELGRIPVVVVSASPLAEKAALDMGAAGWVRKPFTSDDLVSTVERSSLH